MTQLLVGPPGSIAHPPGGMSRSAGVAQWREWAAEGVGTPRGLPAGKEEDCHSTNSEEDKPIINRMRQTKVKFKKNVRKLENTSSLVNNTLSSMASNPIDIRWIRTDFQPY